MHCSFNIPKHQSYQLKLADDFGYQNKKEKSLNLHFDNRLLISLELMRTHLIVPLYRADYFNLISRCLDIYPFGTR